MSSATPKQDSFPGCFVIAIGMLLGLATGSFAIAGAIALWIIAQGLNV